MSTKHSIRRARHELVGRTVVVAAIEFVTPRMRRFHFESEELDGFASRAADDHIAIFVPGPDGEETKRHYTPRAFDATRRRLVVDFATHEAGPATEWAESARVGDVLAIGGPKSSLVVEDDFDWYLLVGDETALPAIGRRVETLRKGAAVTTIATVFDEKERQHFETEADWQAVWLERGEPDGRDLERVVARLASHVLPAGDGFVWIAGEASFARGLRAFFVERGHPAEWLRVAGYWKRGVPDVHEVMEE